MKKVLPYILSILLLSFAACKKDSSQDQLLDIDSLRSIKPSQEIPGRVDTGGTTNPYQEASAVISGKIAPLDILKTTTVIVRNDISMIDYAVRLKDDGSFVVANLPAGRYKIIMNTGNPQFDITMYGILLNGGQVKDLQTIKLSNSGYTVYGNSTITGKVQPANGGNVVAAYHIATQKEYYGTIDGGGNFTVKDLPEGAYYVSVSAAANFTAAEIRSNEATLARNQTVDAGTYLFYDNANANSPNYLSYELDGVKKYKDYYIESFYNSPAFSLSSWRRTSVYQSFIDMRTSIIADKLAITLDEVIGVGTYVLKGRAKSSIKITHVDIVNKGMRGPTAGPTSVWSTIGAGGEGTITITAVDEVNKTISGTFSAIAVPESGSATGNRVITNGAFANFKYSAQMP